MKAAPRKISLLYSLIPVLLMALSQAAQAQVGIRSGSAQLTLIARSAPHASIRTVEPARQIGRSGTLVEASTLVRWSANTGHRLLVRGGAPASRIWVQDLNGVYQELTGASSVTVARHQHGGGQWERQVRYRVEASGNGELAGPLQVQYEIAVNPAI